MQSLELLGLLAWAMISEEMLGLLFIRAHLFPHSTSRFLPMMNPLVHAFLTKFHTFPPPFFFFFPLQFFSFLKVHCCLAFAGPDIRELVSFAEYPTWTLSVRVSVSPTAPGLGAIPSPKSPKVTFFPLFSLPSTTPSTAALDFSRVFSFCYWLVFKLCDLWP